MLLLCDVDGVILDWHSGYCNYFQLNQTVPDEYNADAKFSLERIDDFNRSDRFGELKPMFRSNEVFPKLLDSKTGIDIHFVTSAIPSGLSTYDRIPVVNRRISNIEKAVFGLDYSPAQIKYSMLELRHDKTPVYAALALGKRNVFVVEDHIDTALSVAANVHNASVLLMRQAYNDNPAYRELVAATSNVRYVDDWYDVQDAMQSYQDMVLDASKESANIQLVLK